MNPCIQHHKVPRATIISENEVSITVQLCSSQYTTVRIKNCLKRTSIFKVVTMKNTDGAVHTSYCLKVKYPLRFFVSYVQLITKQHESRTV